MIVTQKNAHVGFSKTRLDPKTSVNEVFSVHLDYLRVKGKLSPEEFDNLIEFIGKDEVVVELGVPWNFAKGAKKLDHKLTGITGFIGGFSYDEEAGSINFIIDFSGKYFDRINVVDQWRFCRGLYYKYNCISTRIDIAVDDCTYKHIPIYAMRKAWEEGNNFRFINHQYIESGKNPKALEKTWYFGSRESGKMVRVYDHDHECLRFEAEFKKSYSRLIFEALCTMEKEWFTGQFQGGLQEWVEMLANEKIGIDEQSFFNQLHACNEDFDLILQKTMFAFATGAIDFRNKNEQKDPSRACYRDTTRLDFYQEFIDKMGMTFRVRTVKEKPTIQNKIAWIDRQVSKTISVIHDAIGAIRFDKYLDKVIKEGRRRQDKIDEKNIQYIRSHPGLVQLNLITS